MCGFEWALKAVKRNKFRHKHKINGNGCFNCLGTTFCPCCGLVQDEKESLLREGKKTPGNREGYQVNPGMGYQEDSDMA